MRTKMLLESLERSARLIAKIVATLTLLSVFRTETRGSEAQFGAAEYSVTEAASVVSIQATRSETLGVEDLRVLVMGGSAQSSINYVMTTNLLRFQDGASTADLQIYLIDDADPSGDRDILLELSPETAGTTIGATGTTRVAILDDDAPGYPGLGIGGYTFTFIPFGGLPPRLNSVIWDSQGRLLGGGAFTSANGSPRTNFVRFLSDGSIDETFSPTLSTDNWIFPVALTQEGKILIGGQFTTVNGANAGRIAQLLPDGNLDPQFHIGAGFSGYTVETLEVLPDNRILVGGDISAYEGVPRRSVAILNPDGTLDPTFDPATVPFGLLGHGALWTGSGIVVIADYGSGPTNFVFQLAANGTRDPGFVCDIPDNPGTRVTGILRESDGRIVISGLFTSVNGIPRNNIARLNTDGSTDESFDPGNGTDGWVFRVVPGPPGKLLIVGDFLEYDGQPRPHVAMINGDGSLDESFNPGTGAVGPPFTSVYSGIVNPDGSVYLGGSFTSYAGVNRFGLALANPDGSAQLQSPRFISIQPGSGPGTLVVPLLCEPGYDAVLFGSETLAGWQSLSTNRSPRRVIEFNRPTGGANSLFFKAEQHPPPSN